MRLDIAFLTFIVAVLISESIISLGASTIESDMKGTVTQIIDGDTFDISSGYRIRLADIDAPERGENGYSSATAYLQNRISGSIVQLDVDDVYRWDYRGTGDRLVCVAYIDYNSTHYENVNKALLVSGHAKIENFENEFSPSTWTLYVPKEASNEIPNEPLLQPRDSMLLQIIIVSALVVLVVGLIVRKKRN